jgi:hypothetical protein
MKDYLKGMSFAEEEKLLSVPSKLVREIPPGMILRVYTNWDRRPRRSLLIKGEFPVFLKEILAIGSNIHRKVKLKKKKPC